MTWDEISTILQIIGGIVLGASFIVAIAIIWVGLKASKEKDAKAKEQEERIANLDLKRAEAERDLGRIKERLHPRSISDQQAEQIIKYLEGRPKSPIMIDFAGVNAESRQFAQRIVDVLTSAGWYGGQSHIVGESRYGFGIVATDKFESNAFDLHNAFREADIDLPVVIRPIKDGPQFWLVVGEKNDLFDSN